MKRTSLWLFIAALLIGIIGMQPVHANNYKPSPQPANSGWSVNLRTIKIFDEFTTRLAKARPLPTTTVKTKTTNSSITNLRPNGYYLTSIIISIQGGSDYYPDALANGETSYFTVPDIAGVSLIRVYQLSEDFTNVEIGILTTNGGATRVYGRGDPGGANYMDFDSRFDIVNGINMTIY